MNTEQLITPPPFIGDLSTQDAAVLATMAKGRRVLEFGSGGSTQIFAEVSREIVSMETDGDWILRTQRNLARLEAKQPLIRARVRFMHYSLDALVGLGPFDMIFVDGESSRRHDFAAKAFAELGEGGIMAFHDSRTTERDVVLQVALWNSEEVEAVHFHIAGSNVAAICKATMAPYQNWNLVEQRQGWEHGGNEDVPGDFYEKILDRTQRHWVPGQTPAPDRPKG